MGRCSVVILSVDASFGGARRNARRYRALRFALCAVSAHLRLYRPATWPELVGLQLNLRIHKAPCTEQDPPSLVDIDMGERVPVYRRKYNKPFQSSGCRQLCRE